MKTKSDEELMLEYAGGNSDAFDELFRRYGQKIYNLFLRNLGDMEISQDLLQECFMRMTVARHRYQPRKAFSNWIITIALNLLRDKYRQSKRRKNLFVSNTLDEGRDFPENSQAGADTTAEKAQMRETVEKALNSLPEEQREVIVLNKYHGLSFSEIGEILKISPQAARQKAYRGIQNLRKKLSHLDKE